MCGEQLRRIIESRRWRGSSPRVRGTAAQRRRELGDGRFIPACAGNRFEFFFDTQIYPVHPRVCGEQGFIQPRREMFPGSSPRVRGTVIRKRESVSDTRFIPACAGNSRPIRVKKYRGTVHPRVCGEQSFRSAEACSTSGSSPRVRGTALLRVPDDSGCRFIPACAGNRQVLTLGRFAPAVHPRVCGEQRSGHWITDIGIGSSPRVRGTVRRPHPV